jgi:murein DD-endopeptidase MepM/ murein hydrolase activator NlpD
MRKEHLMKITLLAVAVTLVAACGADPLRGYFLERTPRDRYEASLRDAGLAGTALAGDWMAAGERAVRQAAVIETPYREVGYLDPAAPGAEAYQLGLREGQKLIATIGMETERATRLFIDLFILAEREPPEPVLLATADSLARTLQYVARRDGSYLLRIQPELLRGGRYTLTVDITPSLDFPVLGRDTRAIRSQFGASRDGGRRSHHGVDIFAPRGTPVVAASRGRVSWVGSSRLGGRVVWLREREMGYALYYAHLDSQAVRRGTVVAPGDTLGFVGNSGNARTTPPHLHFGIYLRGTGPVDPFPFLHRPEEEPLRLSADDGSLGQWVRASGDGVRLRRAPSPNAGVVRELSRHTALKVVAATASWYRVSLPDGSIGFVAARLTESATQPIRVALLTGGSLVRQLPTASAAPVDSVPHGEVPVHGVFGDFVYVMTPTGRSGWILVE